jgi:hypothetical protein
MKKAVEELQEPDVQPLFAKLQEKILKLHDAESTAIYRLDEVIS